MVEQRKAAILGRLRQQRLLPHRSVVDRLLTLDDPFAVIAHAPHVGMEKGILDMARLETILQAMGVKTKQESEDRPAETAGPIIEQAATSLIDESTASTEAVGRIIAPIEAAEPVAPLRMHGLPDYVIDDFPTVASDVDTELTINFDITGNSITEGKMADMNNCFNSRLERIRGLIIRGGEMPSRPLEVFRLQNERRSFTGHDNVGCAIGLVGEPRLTKNGHLLFDLEDSSGSFTCLVRKDENDPNPHIQHGLMPDDVVGVSGSFSQNGDLFYVNDLYFPPLRRRGRIHAEEAQVSVAFLSDIHVGSKTFLEAQWHKMVHWFHNDPLARTIKYLVLSGDCVDGVGIYPNQDKELAIPDLYEQYDEFARLLHLLPDWVECLMLPGNHDAVRPAEPQPALEPEIQQSFNTTTFVGNPCDFSLHGVRLLSYHGKSIDDYVAGMRNVTYSNPVQAMREMLQRRHLAPQWGGKTPLSPEPEDNLVISTVPDIFVTGHVHGHACLDYRGTTLVCSSTWQDQTSYQRMLGFQPKPCILTVVNLGTHMTASIPFA